MSIPVTPSSGTPAVPESSISGPADSGTGQRLGRRALVLGGSLAGLLSGSVLAERFDQVVIVERDDISAQSSGARRGVPQGQHTHGLLVSGSQALERLLPGFTEDLIAQGAVPTDIIGRFRWRFGPEEQARFDSGMEGLLASRPLIEDEVRRRVLRMPNVVLLGGYDIVGLAVSEDRRRVLGAQVAARTPETSPPAELIEGGAVLADLVVDATGRGSRAATWMADLGYPAVEESVVEAGLTYVTRHFRHKIGVLDDLDADISGDGAGGTRTGVAIRQEGGIWAVTLCGGFGEQPPTELAEFLTFARGLPTSGTAEVAAECEPIEGPLTFRYPSSRWLHWEKVVDPPERFAVIGDALCSFNPVYGQGMSSAALQAEALAEVLNHGLTGLSARAAKAFAEVVATPWILATGSDRRHPSQPTKPLAERLLDRYLDRVLATAAHDREVTMAFSRVLNLLAAPPSLMAPRIVVRVLRPARRRSPTRVAA